MRQKDTRRLLQMVETIAKVLIPRVASLCAKQHRAFAESAKKKKKKRKEQAKKEMSALLRLVTDYGNREEP